jgi:hypothetical protein
MVKAINMGGKNDKKAENVLISRIELIKLSMILIRTVYFWFLGEGVYPYAWSKEILSRYVPGGIGRQP